MNQTIGRAALNALKGSLIGAANTIPGVSGGTIAVVTRLYDELIAAVSGFVRTGWRKNLAFLAPIIVGVAAGIVLFARIVEFFMEGYPAQTAFFFMGLILGSVPFLTKITLRERFRGWYLVPFVISFGVLIAMAAAGRPPSGEPVVEITLANVMLVFLAGVVSSATMIIPGVSGSFVLLLIGMYSTFIEAASTLNMGVLAVLVPGFLVGIVAVSKLIHFLLLRFHGVTYWGIIGLVLGSVPVIWTQADVGSWLGDAGAAGVITSLLAIAGGFLLAYFLGSSRKEQRRADSPGSHDSEASAARSGPQPSEETSEDTL
jgi:putative membrane protein